MEISNKESYEIIDHNGKKKVMKGDRLKNYLLVFRNNINVEYKKHEPEKVSAVKETKTVKSKVSIPKEVPIIDSEINQN